MAALVSSLSQCSMKLSLKKITYTIVDGRKVTLLFTKSKEGTHIELNFEAVAQNPIELQQDGHKRMI
jgi:hypothetical protein